MKTCRTCWSRRDFLFRSGGGVSGLALAYLLNQDKLLADAPDRRTFYEDMLWSLVNSKHFLFVR